MLAARTKIKSLIGFQRWAGMNRAPESIGIREPAFRVWRCRRKRTRFRQYNSRTHRGKTEKRNTVGPFLGCTSINLSGIAGCMLQSRYNLEGISQSFSRGNRDDKSAVRKERNRNEATPCRFRAASQRCGHPVPQLVTQGMQAMYEFTGEHSNLSWSGWLEDGSLSASHIGRLEICSRI